MDGFIGGMWRQLAQLLYDHDEQDTIAMVMGWYNYGRGSLGAW